MRPTFLGRRTGGMRLCALVLAAAGIAAGAGGQTSQAAGPAPAVILAQLGDFREMGSVLYVAAHPDDENTQLITYLALGRSYRTGYMSLTRGDGGQNLLGPEFGDLLGVIRTQELLAARGLDGGRQFFSRARDFGYSKDYRQTLTKWDHQGVLSDIVRVIRTFRPDIIVTRFPPEPSATHGHHTASSALALEAFKLSGDPKAFPEQLGGTVTVWQPKRILWNGYGPNWGGPVEPAHGVLHVTIDGTDPVSGASFAVLAAKSRSMHKTQGFANFSVASLGTGARVESFTVMDGAPAEKDPMDGVDTTWARVPGGAEIGELADKAIARFDPANPSASVPDLLQIKAGLARLAGTDTIVAEKARLLDRILQACLGLSVETTVSSAEFVPGEKVKVHEVAVIRSKYPVTWTGAVFPEAGASYKEEMAMSPGAPATREETWSLPPDTPLSQPYWLRQEGTPGMFSVSDPSLIGRPENPPAIPVEDSFRIGDQVLVVRHEAMFAERDEARGVTERRPQIVAPVSLAFAAHVQLFQPGSPRNVTVTVTAARPNDSGFLRLEAPAGWRVSPLKQAFQLLGAGDKASFTFAVTPPSAASTAAVTAWADIGGGHFNTDRATINYPHVPLLTLQPTARLKAVCAPVAIKGREIGYLPGAGDSTVASLEQMGYHVSSLSGADLTAQNLRKFDAVVIGVRAFNTRTDLAANLPGLFAYAENGGTVIEQYNTPGGLQTPDLAPYMLRLSRELPRYRVTDEKSAVTFLEPEHPVFNTPNKITAADFEGWVQERGLDFASEWDSAHFTPLIACSDVGEAPLQGGLLVAHFGRGYYVYTGLSFFRQFPAGVPGAYRLFANLVSLGK
ncbi:MAG TPA: PIG-L family deacetylase [Opitutaceae bacterium]|nr:PIG-L family deacetylase [Opitutaceae bacterium]